MRRNTLFANVSRSFIHKIGKGIVVEPYGIKKVIEEITGQLLIFN